MARNIARSIAFAGLVLVATTACQMYISQLKTASAGHTGCTPAQITISNHAGSFGYNETWNATCNGTVYLCSGVGNGRSSEDYSCAPAVR